MSELGPDARSLVDAVLDADEPSVDDAARVRAKVEARLALIAAAAVVATVSPKASAGAGGAIGASTAAGGSAAAGAVAGGAAAGGGIAGGAAAGGGAAASAWIAAKIAIGVGLGGAAVATSLVIGSPSSAPTSTTPSVSRATPAVVAAPVPDRPTSAHLPSDPSRATPRNATRREEPPSTRASRPPDAAPARATRSSSSVRPRAARRNEAVPAPDSTPSAVPDAPTPDDRTRAAQGSATHTDSPSQYGVAPKPTSSSSTQDSPVISPAKASSIDAPTQGSATVSAPKDSVVEEAALLHAAREALAGGDAKAALTLLDEHGARFPKGALVAERQAARVFALCALGWSVEARRAASAFLTQNPRSPLAARVRNACAPPRSRP
jgi:hypothetical protein